MILQGKTFLESTLELQDLSISSFLYASTQVKMLGKKKLPNGSSVFLFSPREAAEELVTQYWTLQAPSIQPKLLFSAQRDLKDLLYKS